MSACAPPCPPCGSHADCWRADPNLAEHDDPRAEHEAEGRKEARETGWRDDYDGRLADGAAADDFYNRGGAA